jgi:PmbA protein
VIGPLLERAVRRAEAADAALKTDETLTLVFEAGRLKSTAFSQESGLNLRVSAAGRLGFAGTTGDDVDALLEAALASARVGDAVDLLLPAPAPLPTVTTCYPRVVAATLDNLMDLGRGLVDRLTRDGCQVAVTVERSVGSVEVANTRGVAASYDVSVLTVAAEVTRVAGDDVLMVADYWASADFPDDAATSTLAQSILQRLEWADRPAGPPHGALPVLFTPQGAHAVLLPLRQACHGKAVLQGISPLAGRQGDRMFDAQFTIEDDPFLEAAPGSRPIDDEAVPTRRLSLVQEGEIGEFIYDLETACRAGVPATGHARRSTFGKPQAAFSNLAVAAGPDGWDDLLRRIPDGLLVDELIGVGQGNVIGGVFSHPVALAYRVVHGEIVGRVKDAAVAGNAYELLGRLGGLGRDVERRGSLLLPPILLEGVAVSPR